MDHNYEIIKKSIEFIQENSKTQPSLEAIANHVHLSKYYFERLFKKWAGTTPERFSKYLTKEYAKDLLNKSNDVLTVSYDVGLSSSSRLHDLFIKYEAITSGEYKKMKALNICYGFNNTPFGESLVAFSNKGICELIFIDNNKEESLKILYEKWKGAKFVEDQDKSQELIYKVFSNKNKSTSPINILLKGTNFQIKVWEALLRIPSGSIVSYKQVANAINNPKAFRAVGSACANNSIAYLIPCHRVLQSSSGLGGYKWNNERKKIMLAWESALINNNL